MSDQQYRLRATTGHGLQWALRVPLLPSAVSVQPAWRLGAGHATARQQSQCEILEEGATVGDRALSPLGHSEVLYHSFQYQAKSWQRARRVVAKIEWHAGELFPRVGFIATNLNKHSKNLEDGKAVE